MSFSQKIKADWVGEGRQIAAAFTADGDTKVSFDQIIPSNASDKEYALAFDATNLKLLYILSGTDFTVKTNSSGTPDDTINIVGGLPLIWVAPMNAYYVAPITTDVLKIFVTDVYTVGARLQIEALFNSTV